MTPEATGLAVQTAIQIIENIRVSLIHPERRTREELIWTACVVDKQLSIALDVLRDFKDEERK
ncbi:MAG: hypothetical protein ACJ8CB_00245 [Ktedonobacteraceae bacterium]